MAFLDTGGTGALRKLTGVATVAVSAWAVSQIEPSDTTTSPTTTVTLKVLVSSSDASNTDVQIQVATENTFSSPVVDVTLTNKPDGFVTALASGLVNLTNYYWRARAAQTGTTAWTVWSPIWSFGINTVVGAACSYVYSNFGIDPAMVGSDAEYVFQNFGIEQVHEDVAQEYVNYNHGVEVTRRSVAVEYVHEGDVNTGTPDPRIWFVTPDNGRAGDGIRIFGFGFGDLQSQYAGSLEWRNGVEWDPLSVTSWQTFPPTVNAYTAARQMDMLSGEMDMQHTVIEVQIPVEAVPPGVSFRLVTDGS
jgi:hypothetical protein